MEVLGDMQLLVGPPEQLCISNAALMMFCEHLDKFFPYTQVEITKFPEGSIKNPNNFIEVPVIKGSVPTMIKRTMEKLQEFLLYKRNLEIMVLLKRHLKRMMKEEQLLLRYLFIRIS